MKRIVALCVALAAAVALAACSAGTPASSSAASSSETTASASSSASSTVSSSASAASSSAVAGGDVVVIPLDYNAGTGYEWQCSADPDGVVEQVGQVTVNQADDQDVAGGPLRDEFSFQAIAPGEVVLTFELVRSWEGEPAETQTYAFTVSEDLNLVLNPYKSDFVNEPEWTES